MARITCSKSGITFNCEHMPIAFGSSTYEHPMFHVPQKKLLALAGTWAAGKLSPIESYLLYLSLLNSTSLVQWRVHAQYLDGATDSMIANNMESLIQIIGKLNLISHPSFTLPSFAISQDTCTLANSNHWIEVWTENYVEWYDGFLTARKREELKGKLDSREEALQRLIKSSVPVDSYANTLADWAALAGAFPTHSTLHPITGASVPLAEYWKQIIRAVSNEDKLWRYPRADIVELLEHCEDTIQHGNIYSHKLMGYLRSGLRKYDDYLGFGDVAISTGGGTPFQVMPPSSSVQDINTSALLSTAPEEEPKKHQYPSLHAWLKAYTKWKLANSKPKV